MMIECVILIIIVLELILVYKFIRDERSRSNRYTSVLNNSNDNSDYLNIADDIKRQKSLAELTYYKNLCPIRNNDRHLT